MNTVERHKKYVHDLSGVGKESKQKVSDIVYGRLGELMKLAGDNPQAFLALVKRDRRKMTALVAQHSLTVRKTAIKLGSEFGKERASGSPKA